MEKDYGISTFTILSIDEEKQVVKIGRKNLKTLKTLEFERAISKVFDDVDTIWWIPYEDEETFKVGDMFYVGKEGTSKTYQVTLVEGQNFTFVRGNDDGTIESYEGLYSTDEANAKLKDGKWVKISKEKEAPEEQYTFKTGDKFDMLDSTNQKYQVTDISGDRFSFKMDNGINVYTTIYTTSEANSKLKEGSWVKILDEEAPKEESQFKIGDKYLNKTVKDTFTIVQVYTDYIDVKFTGGNEATYDMQLCKEKVADGTWVKVLDEEKGEPKNYKVGDKFLWAKEDITFVIDFIKNGELGIIYSDGLTGFISTEQFEQGLSTGYYKPYTEEAKPEEKKTRKPRQPRTKSEQDKKIEHILDINLDEIQF
jgi:translation elongation factor P/translation initiation factor 5A